MLGLRVLGSLDNGSLVDGGRYRIEGPGLFLRIHLSGHSDRSLLVFSLYRIDKKVHSFRMRQKRPIVRGYMHVLRVRSIFSIKIYGRREMEEAKSGRTEGLTEVSARALTSRMTNPLPCD